MSDLEKVGYLCIRSGASLSPVDVVAIGSQGVRLIQCKTDTAKRPLYPSELEIVRESLRDLPCPLGVTYEIWVWRTGTGWRLQECV
jgi:hypothetical protein